MQQEYLFDWRSVIGAPETATAGRSPTRLSVMTDAEGQTLAAAGTVRKLMAMRL